MEKLPDDWVELVPDVVRVPYTAYKHRRKLSKWMTHLQAFVDKGSTDIVVLGVPASGKSVLTSFLYGEINNLTYDLPDASRSVEVKAISLNQWTYLFRVIPGQTSAVRFDGLNASVTTNPKLMGVVYVVNYGYTEVRDATLRTILVKEKGVESVEELRQRNLDLELRDFTYFVDKLIETHAVHDRPKWICIVCSKVDLFRDDLEAAQRYYDVNGSSPFSKQLTRLQNHIGKTRFKVASAPVSSYLKDFEWNSNVVKSQMSGTDSVNALLKNLVQTLANLSGDE